MGKTVEIIASSYGYRKGDTVTLPSWEAALLIRKGHARGVDAELKITIKPKAKKKK